MKIFLERAIFINRAPFDQLDLKLNENEIAVLSAVNGKGKTTILSHIVDAFYEMARPHFQDFESTQNKYYRISSGIYNLIGNQPSFVYLRFKTAEEVFDYVDIRSTCTEEEYNRVLIIENKIPFSEIKQNVQTENNIKHISSNFNKSKAEKIFSNNVLTYFPSYRYEVPGYLNDPYKTKLDFKKKSRFAGYLHNPIEVLSGLPQLANWIMDIVLDMQYSMGSIHTLKYNIDSIISKSLISKGYGNPRFGIGPRGFGESRIQVVESQNKKQIYPSIFNLSSGESALLCLFGEILRQADNNKDDIPLSDINGIVLVDEIDKHLHIKLQKNILPDLFKLFPNVQFIVSSHSPFLSMGLAEQERERSKIIDLDNFGISKDPTTNELYTEVYNMMVDENVRFKEMYKALEQEISDGRRPLIITEGKTDVKHLKKAKEKLNLINYDIDFFQLTEDSWGDTKLKSLLEHLSKVPQSRKIIGIFDRDVVKIVSDIEKDGQSYKNYGNNVYSFCIPVPPGREKYQNISIEFYYTDDELKKKKDGRKLYFDNEIDNCYNKTLKRSEPRLSDTVRTENEYSKKIFDAEKMCEVSDWLHSKARFAELVETDENFIEGFDFSNFNLIFDKIREITDNLKSDN